MLLFSHFSLLLKDFVLYSPSAELKTTMLYFYSALAQSMAALFVVSGIFLIFRIEMIQAEISRGIDNFREWVAFRISERDPAIGTLGINREPRSWLVKDVLDHIDEALKNAKEKNHPYIKAFTDYSSFITYRLNYQKWLKLFSFPPFILIGFIFLNALYSLAIVDLLVYKYRVDLYGDVAFKLGLTLFVIIYLLIFIFFAIRGPRDWIINTPKTR